MGGLRLEVGRDTNKHVRKGLPPSMASFPGEAEIKYYVKATVSRPQFYKENYRSVCEPIGAGGPLYSFICIALLLFTTPGIELTFF